MMTGDEKIKKFIDFEKNSEIIYVNYYLDEYKLVIKVPIIDDNEHIKIDKFNLSNYTYLAHCE